MYTIEWKKEWPSMLLIGLMLLAGIVFYPHLPERIPMHWNIHGEVDNYVTKNPFTGLLFPLIALGIFLLMLFLPYVDPRREKYEKFGSAYRLIRVTIIGLFAFLYATIIASSLGFEWQVAKLVPAGIAVLFIILGNVMGKLRQNYFVGVKLPWTLANEDVWNRTHRMAGRLFVSAGILGLIGVLLPPAWTMTCLMVGLFGALITTVVYSAVIYQRTRSDSEGKV